MFAMRLAALLYLLQLVAGDECEETPQFLQHSLQLDAQEVQAAHSKTSRSVKAKTSTFPGVETFNFFVNFHDVGDFATVINVITHQSKSCSQCGGFLFTCQEDGLTDDECQMRQPGVCTNDFGPHGCSSHTSLRILEEAISGEPMTKAINVSDLTSLKNLWPDSKRHDLLTRSAQSLSWLPLWWGPLRRILTTTVLRDPVKKLRSAYNRINETHPMPLKAFLKAQRDFVAGNASDQMPPLRKAVMNCCEYSFYLGNGDVNKSRRVLASQFDMVGIAELLPETMVSLGRLYGKTPAGMGTIARDALLEVPDAEDWDKEDQDMVEFITRKDRAVYEFAKELFERQSVSIWNNADVLKKQADLFEDARNTPWEPE